MFVKFTYKYIVNNLTGFFYWRHTNMFHENTSSFGKNDSYYISHIVEVYILSWLKQIFCGPEVHDLNQSATHRPPTSPRVYMYCITLFTFDLIQLDGLLRFHSLLHSYRTLYRVIVPYIHLYLWVSSFFVCCLRGDYTQYIRF